jgi:hypothetical protein
MSVLIRLAATALLPALAACGNLDYLKDPDYIVCNEGAPMGRNERIEATAPNPGAIRNRPPDCRMGPDGLVRLRRPPATDTKTESK